MTAELDTWANRLGRTLDPLAVSTVEQPEDYNAWGQDHAAGAMLDFRLRSDITGEEIGELLPSHYLMRVSYTGNKLHGDVVSFAFADCLIVVRGHNLKDLRAAVKNNKIDYLQEFDAERWPQPVGGAPVIDKIEIVAPTVNRSSRA